MKLEEYEGNEELEEEGVWLKYDDVEFLLGAHLSRRHRRAIEKWRKRLAAGLRKSSNMKAQDELTINAAAEGIVLNWRGPVTYHGKDLPYSTENAVQLLRVKAVRDWVIEQSATIANYQKEEEAAVSAALKSGTDVASGVGEGSGIPSGS